MFSFFLKDLFFKTLFNYKNILLIIFISFAIFFSKWIISYYFIKEDILIKILFESGPEGHFWYPYIKFLSNFNLNYSYDPYIHNLKILFVPYGSLIFHVIFYKIFGIIGLVIIEFFAILIFFTIFYKIFSFNFSSKKAILFTLILFLSPFIFQIINHNYFIYANTFVENFFSLRPHRPIMANIYFYLYIYILLKISHKNFFKKKYFIYIGIIMGLSFSSFYFFFLIKAFSFFFFLIYMFRRNFFLFFKKNFLNFLLLIFFFFSDCIPLFFNIKIS